jgi:hypothetical protein
MLKRRIQRGMTLAPRVEIYTHIACRILHSPPAPSPVFSPPSFLRPHAVTYPDDVVHIRFQDLPIKVYDECTADPKVQARAARIQACMAILPYDVRILF